MNVQYLIDKTDWPSGPWLLEPDGVFWLDTESNFPCVVHRTKDGTLSGLVGLRENHPLFNVDRTSEEFDGYDIHAGWSYSFINKRFDLEFQPICVHWWIGFACNQDKDFIPMNSDKYQSQKRYRTLRYVKREVTQLAKQLNGKLYE